VRLETKLAPRSLNDAQRAAMAEQLRGYADTRVDVVVFSQGSTPDTPTFAISLVQVFASAGWKPLAWTALTGPAVITGVLVSIRDGSEPQINEAANTLVAALTAEGIDAARYDQLNFRTGEAGEVPASGVNGPPWDIGNVAPIRLLIGTKP